MPLHNMLEVTNLMPYSRYVRMHQIWICTY